MSLREKRLDWYEKHLASKMSLEDIELIAWHHMINDPYLSTYIMVDGKEVRKYVNPKLAYKRALMDLAPHFQEMAQYIIDRFMPAFADMGRAFQELANSSEQLGLIPSLTDGDDV